MLKELACNELPAHRKEISFSKHRSGRLTTRCLKPFIMGGSDVVFQRSPFWITDSKYPQRANF